MDRIPQPPLLLYRLHRLVLGLPHDRPTIPIRKPDDHSGQSGENDHKHPEKRGELLETVMNLLEPFVYLLETLVHLLHKDLEGGLEPHEPVAVLLGEAQPLGQGTACGENYQAQRQNGHFPSHAHGLPLPTNRIASPMPPVRKKRETHGKA